MNDLIIESKEIHKSIKRKFTKRPILVSSIDDVWSIDLIDLSQFKKQNNNYSYILSGFGLGFILKHFMLFLGCFSFLQPNF